MNGRRTHRSDHIGEDQRAHIALLAQLVQIHIEPQLLVANEIQA